MKFKCQNIVLVFSATCNIQNREIKRLLKKQLPLSRIDGENLDLRHCALFNIPEVAWYVAELADLSEKGNKFIFYIIISPNRARNHNYRVYRQKLPLCPTMIYYK